MRHAREDYNRIQDPSEKIPEDEPVFLLRGQDAAAADTVAYWAELNEQLGGDPRLSAKARAWADKMEKWPNKKPADL